MNTKPNHTPGPWTVQPDPEWAGKHTYHDHRFVTAGPDKLNSDEWGHSDENVIICSLRDCPNQEANARLIASAPELIAALEKIVNLPADDEGCRCITPPSMETIHAATAKAKGEKV